MFSKLWLRWKCLWTKYVLVPYRFWKLENYFFPDNKCDPIFSPISYATSAMTVAEEVIYRRRLTHYQNQAHWRDIEKSASSGSMSPEDLQAMANALECSRSGD